jgi:hypothetical protein
MWLKRVASVAITLALLGALIAPDAGAKPSPSRNQRIASATVLAEKISSSRFARGRRAGQLAAARRANRLTHGRHSACSVVAAAECRARFLRVTVPPRGGAAYGKPKHDRVGRLVAVAAPAFAAKPGGGGGGGGSGAASTPSGYDISWPQCGSTFPSAPEFGIVGVNGGRADDLNPCLGPSSAYPSYTQSELYWALATATGGTAQPNASLYLNTADPGNVYNRKPIGDWPTSGNTPHGSCTTTAVRIGHTTYTLGQNSAACAWQYGYNMAVQDAGWLSAEATLINAQEQSVSVPGAASSYPWWLDVETANTWQSGTSGQAMNIADLQGMIAALQASPNSVTAVGAYSTSSQWNQITGGTSTSAAGSLYGIPNWIPGATTLSGAQSNCGLPSFTLGTVSLTQWTGTFDSDYACP